MNAQVAQALASAFETLPTENIVQTMSLLSDLDSLQALTQTCPRMYSCFYSDPGKITCKVLQREIRTDVLPEAIAVFETATRNQTLAGNGRQTVADRLDAEILVTRHTAETRLTPSTEITLAQAFQMRDFHLHVRYFAEDFAAESLTLATRAGSPPQPPPSLEEVARFERAFYRYELFCNTCFEGVRVGKRSGLSPHTQRALLFDTIAPWEGEQLGCIYDYLMRKIAPAYNEMAEHDVHWAVFNPNLSPVEFLDLSYLNPFLARGLAFLRQVGEATTYTEVSRLLPERQNPDHIFLHSMLGIAKNQEGPHDADPDGLGATRLCNFTDAHERRYVGQPFFQDQDGGPEYAWRWAHQESRSKRFMWTGQTSCLRRWGYVFWDRTRLNDFGLNSGAWASWTHQLPSGPFTIPSNWLEGYPMTSPSRLSLRTRLAIDEVGGSGWWDESDETRIVWPAGSDPNVMMERVAQNLAIGLLGTSSSLSQARLLRHTTLP
ncbi:hypothetical protein B0J14DRAFT_658055 [Halenospora varia]|nr:hypothetical protein B0J14DRAFT_658055 [Halenospora varia]